MSGPRERAAGVPMARALAFALAMLSAWLALPTASVAVNSCGAFSTSASTSASAKPGQNLCHDTTGTTDSEIIDVRACDHFSVHLDPDVTWAGTGCEAYVWRCTQASTTSCVKIMEDTDADGVPNDVTLTGDGTTSRRNGYDWQTASWLWIDVTANPSGHSCRTTVECK